MVAYAELSTVAEKHGLADGAPAFAGVKQDLRTLEWIWDSKFAAIAADNPAWEVLRESSDPR
jgi:hypothetical protein